MKTIQLGDIRIDRIVESESPLFEPTFLLPDATPEAIDPDRDWLEPRFIDPASKKLIMSFHSYLIRTPRKTILVDACVGNDKNRPHRNFWHKQNRPYLKDMAALGVHPEQVDCVMCTHLHIDHVGWNTRLVDGRWVPTFPNAKYLFARKEYEFWDALHKTNPEEPVNHGSFEDSVLPVMEAGRAVLVDDDHEIDTGMQLEAAHGHTAGNVVVNIKSKESRAVLCGDTLQHAVQVAHPGWSSRFCHDPVQSAETRTKLVDGIADTDTLLLAAHFPSPVAGTVVRHQDRYRFKPRE